MKKCRLATILKLFAVKCFAMLKNILKNILTRCKKYAKIKSLNDDKLIENKKCDAKTKRKTKINHKVKLIKKIKLK